MIEELMQLGFSEIESKVYLKLLEHNRLNGSQIAKILNLPRTSVYNALDKLYDLGAVSVSAGTIKVYHILNHNAFVEKMRSKYDSTISNLIEMMDRYQKPLLDHQYWNFKGKEQFISITKEWILQANREILLNTDHGLDLFSEEINRATDSGVKIHLYSVRPFKTDNVRVNYYCNRYWNEFPEVREMSRFQMVVDLKKVLIAGLDDHHRFLGLYTENPLLVHIIGEHIHQDIYMAKMNEKYGKNMVEQEFLVDSLLEKWFLKTFSKTDRNS